MVIMTTEIKKEYYSLIVNGKRHGLYKEWYDNGQLKIECTFDQGKHHGLYK